MVSVKTPSGWKKVGIGETVRGVTNSTKKRSSSSSSSMTSSSSSSNSNNVKNDFLNKINGGKGTYDIKTQTYTDSKGNKQSMNLGNALKSRATIIKEKEKVRTVTDNRQSRESDYSKPVDQKITTGTVDVYREPTKEEIEFDKQASKSYKRNKIIDKAKELYDNSIGKLFSGTTEWIVGGYQDSKKENERNIYGGYGIKEEKDYSFGNGQGTVMTDTRFVKDEELIENAPYVATDIIANRESVKLQGIAEEKSAKIQEETKRELEKINQDYQNSQKEFWENKVEKGMMSYEEANAKYLEDVTAFAEKTTRQANERAKVEFENYILPELKKTENRISEVDKRAGRNRAKSEIGANLLSGVIVGGGLALMGGVGLVLGGSQLVRTGLDGKKVWNAFKSDPVKFGYEVIPQVVGGIAGAKIALRLSGQGNVKLAGKVGKVPKNLEMNGIVNYLKYMKTIPISKLKKIIGPKGEMVIKGKGGSLTITRTGKGILKAVRKGKNWYEEIVVGTDDVIQGTIKRNLKLANNQWRGADYYIKYKILANGKRVTNYFKGNKKFATIKDTVKPQKIILEELKKSSYKGEKRYSIMGDGVKVFDDLGDDVDYYLGEDGKVYNKNDLSSSKSILEKGEVKKTGQRIKNLEKGKYDIKGEIKHQYNLNELNIADPAEFQKAFLIAKESGNNKALSFLKEVRKQKAIFSDEGGIGKDLIKLKNAKVIYNKDGSVSKIQEINSIKTPTLQIIQKNLKGTTFKIQQTKNPGIVMKALKKIDEAVMNDVTRSGRIYMMTDPVSSAILKIKIPQLKIKTSKLTINQNVLKGPAGKIMSLPKDLTMDQLRYLVGIGAVDLRNILDVLKDKASYKFDNIIYTIGKDKINSRHLIKQRQRLLQKNIQANIQKALMNQQLKQGEYFAEYESEIRTPKTPTPKMNLGTIPPVAYPTENRNLAKIKEMKFDKGAFEMMRFNDPIEALTGKKKYSDKMNIKLTKRYGNLYS